MPHRGQGWASTYLLDAFLQRPPHKRNIREWSNWASREQASDLQYSRNDKVLTDFVEWLEAYLDSEVFHNVAKEFLTSRET
ncbi:hypothetical protein GO009_12885 [Muricauda sp. TY007]|uniref:hypothetical protein n=1 Tax=Allomuricauda sp. TY007 TaxID=2683200 RepID=UPI0013BF9824|nr:hypothetical protein [Muricauda sp. TY007]NDV16921.1 hypothetical protein [Muricauda sp. TY007]